MPLRTARWAAFLFAALIGLGSVATSAQSTRPNIVLIFPDNLGWGEVGAYGSVRGNLTPRIDKLAAEGIRLNNFNVEFSCVVSRASLMTGRYAVRTGATQPSGITLWEVTLAEALKSVGYATGLFGKWHLGGDRPDGKREPTHQGFDEFFGIPRTSNEANTTIAQGATEPGTSFVWEGRIGQPTKNVRIFDMEARRAIDRESAQRGINFMERGVKERKPFFMYYPMTQVHFPALPHPEFTGKARAGDIGAEQRRPWRGSSGPWNGFYNTVMEGGIRTPCIIRWPARIRAGQVTDEIIHQVDFFPTLAAAVGGDIVPKDRAIDGVNQLPFLEGKQKTSVRVLVGVPPNAPLRVASTINLLGDSSVSR